MARSLRSNFLWTLSGNATFAAAQWTVLSAITKLGTTADAGDWTLALAITAPVFILAQLKLRTVQATDVHGENSWGEFLSLRLLGIVVATAVVAAIVAVAYPDHTGRLILLTAVAKAFESISDLVYGREQQQERMDRIARSLIVRGALSAIAGVAVFWATLSTIAAAGAIAASNAACLVWDLRRVRPVVGDQGPSPRWNRARLVALFWRVLPLGVVTAIGSLQVNIPRYFLEAHVTRSELGVFGAIAYVMVAGGMLVTALGNAALPRLSQLFAAGHRVEFARLLRRMLVASYALGGLSILACILLGEPVLRLLYSDEVATHAEILTWLAVTTALLWGYQFLGSALDAMRRFTIQPWIHGASTLVIAIAAYVLVPSHGMRGAAWAMLAGYAVDTALYAIAVAVPLHRMARDG